MATGLLWITVVVVLPEIQNPARSSNKVQETGKSLVAVAKYVDARVRGFLVCKGMTYEQVSGILGNEHVIFLAPGIPKPMILYCYYKYSVYVSYDSDERDVLRVDRVISDSTIR